jgi:hypothetical protein
MDKHRWIHSQLGDLISPLSFFQNKESWLNIRIEVGDICQTSKTRLNCGEAHSATLGNYKGGLRIALKVLHKRLEAIFPAVSPLPNTQLDTLWKSPVRTYEFSFFISSYILFTGPPTTRRRTVSDTDSFPN